MTVSEPFYWLRADMEEGSPDGRIREIALPRGVSGADLVSRVFAAEKGVRPLGEWRKVRGRVDGPYAAFQTALTSPQRWFSQAARAVVDKWRGPQDVVEWLPGELESPDGAEERPYSLLFFPQPFDGADMRYSTAGPGGLIKIVLDPHKLAGRHIAPSPRTGSQGFLVCSHIQRELADLGVRSVCFRPALIAA